MTYSDESDHAFIIRIWEENREIDGASPEWRGVIEHVATGNRRYVRDLAHILAFIIPYLGEMGLKTNILLHLKICLCGLKRALRPPSRRG